MGSKTLCLAITTLMWDSFALAGARSCGDLSSVQLGDRLFPIPQMAEDFNLLLKIRRLERDPLIADPAESLKLTSAVQNILMRRNFGVELVEFHGAKPFVALRLKLIPSEYWHSEIEKIQYQDQMAKIFFATPARTQQESEHMILPLSLLVMNTEQNPHFLSSVIRNPEQFRQMLNGHNVQLPILVRETEPIGSTERWLFDLIEHAKHIQSARNRLPAMPSIAERQFLAETLANEKQNASFKVAEALEVKKQLSDAIAKNEVEFFLDPTLGKIYARFRLSEHKEVLVYLPQARQLANTAHNMLVLRSVLSKSGELLTELQMNIDPHPG